MFNSVTDLSVVNNNNQSQWLSKIAISRHGLENKQPQWLRSLEVKMEHRMPSLDLES